MFSVFVAGLVVAPMGAAMPDEQEKSARSSDARPRDARTVSLLSADVDIVGRLDHLGMTTVETSPERLAQLEESGMIEGTRSPGRSTSCSMSRPSRCKPMSSMRKAAPVLVRLLS